MEAASAITAEALTLARRVLMPAELMPRGVACQADLLGVLALAVYTGAPRLVGHAVAIAYDQGLHTVFAKLTDPTLRGRADEADLLQKGRIFLTTVIYSHVCVVARRMPSDRPVSPSSAASRRS